MKIESCLNIIAQENLEKLLSKRLNFMETSMCKALFVRMILSLEWVTVNRWVICHHAVICILVIKSSANLEIIHMTHLRTNVTQILARIKTFSKQQWTLNTFMLIKIFLLETQINTYIYNLRDQEIIDIVSFRGNIVRARAHPSGRKNDNRVQSIVIDCVRHSNEGIGSQLVDNSS